MFEKIILGQGIGDPNGDSAYDAFTKMNNNMESLTNTVDNFVGASYENIDLSVEDALKRLEVINTTKLDELKTSNKLTLDTFVNNAEISLGNLESVAVERNLALAELQQSLATAVESADVNKQEILLNISTTLSTASDTLSTDNTRLVTQEVMRLDREVDSVLVNINTRMTAVENTANSTKQNLDNKLVESENRVVVLESNVTQLLSDVDTNIDLKLLNIQDQLNIRLDKFNEDTAGILEGSLSEKTRKLLNPVLIQGVSFDGSIDINLNTFSTNQDGLVPKTANALPGTYLDSTGAWINPTESITGTLGKPYGIALLDGQGKVPSDQLPSYVDDVLEFDTLSVFPSTGETGKIYIDTTTNITYRWTGTTYVKITAGEVSSVNGRKGVITLAKIDVGLGLVDNTADADKNVLHALTADSLATAINIQGVSFTGATDIELPIFSAVIDGLVPKKVGDTSTKFLREDGTWVIPTNTTYSIMTQSEAETGTANTSRVITAGVLKAAITQHSPTPDTFTGTTSTGLVPARDGNTTTNYLREDGTWTAPPNTTYSAMSAAELTTGTSTSSRSITAKVLGDEFDKYLPLIGGTLAGDLNVTGTIVATGNITAFSDARLKHNIKPIGKALDKVNMLNGVTFTRNFDNKDAVGLIAQDVLKAMPEAVVNKDDYMTVDYMGLVGLLVESIKELDKRIELLEGK